MNEYPVNMFEICDLSMSVAHNFTLQVPQINQSTQVTLRLLVYQPAPTTKHLSAIKPFPIHLVDGCGLAHLQSFRLYSR